MLNLVFAWFMTTADVRGLAAYAHLEEDVAREHVFSAHLVAAAFHMDADLLLSIARHESNFDHQAVSHERGGYVSCGVMTPELVKVCEPQSMLESYAAGAAHLKGWLDDRFAKDLTERLRGYGGGYALIKACRLGPYLIHRGTAREKNGCQVDIEFTLVAKAIRRASNAAKEK